jgi:hypothetical protein
MSRCVCGTSHQSCQRYRNRGTAQRYRFRHYLVDEDSVDSILSGTRLWLPSLSSCVPCSLSCNDAPPRPSVSPLRDTPAMARQPASHATTGQRLAQLSCRRGGNRHQHLMPDFGLRQHSPAPCATPISATSSGHAKPASPRSPTSGGSERAKPSGDTRSGRRRDRNGIPPQPTRLGLFEEGPPLGGALGHVRCEGAAGHDQNG